MTKVVHCKKEPYDVYIGRGKNCKWGNPYSHKEGTLAEFKVKSRKEAIDKYESYLLSNQDLMNSLHELKGKTLGCWCGNFDSTSNEIKCHGQILMKYANLITTKLF